MHAATAWAPAPNKQKGRVVSATQPQNIACNSSGNDTRLALRLQRLSLLGLIGQRANLVAAMAWEVQHG